MKQTIARTAEILKWHRPTVLNGIPGSAAWSALKEWESIVMDMANNFQANYAKFDRRQFLTDCGYTEVNKA